MVARPSRTVRAAGRRADADSPVAWLRKDEYDGEVLLTVWPGWERRTLALLDPYAHAVRWLRPQSMPTAVERARRRLGS